MIFDLSRTYLTLCFLELFKVRAPFRLSIFIHIYSFYLFFLYSFQEFEIKARRFSARPSALWCWKSGFLSSIYKAEGWIIWILKGMLKYDQVGWTEYIFQEDWVSSCTILSLICQHNKKKEEEEIKHLSPSSLGYWQLHFWGKSSIYSESGLSNCIATEQLSHLAWMHSTGGIKVKEARG